MILEMLHRSKRTGAHVMNIKTDPDNNMGGRDAFKIHGDNKERGASDGCIILPWFARERISSSDDNRLNIVK